MDTNSNVSSPPSSDANRTAPDADGARRLVRRMDHRMLGGVAAGLGDYFGVDPVWFRLAFVASAFLGGAGILLYVAMWIIVPPSFGPVPGQAPLPARVERMVRRIDRTPGWVGVVLLLVGILVVANRIVTWRPGIFWGVVLVALGVLLFQRRTDRGPQVPPVSSPAPPAAELGPEAPTLPPPAFDPGNPPASTVSTDPLAPFVPAQIRRRERSSLGWITVGAMLMALGVAAVLDLGGAVHIALVQYLALALTILGLGLLAGAFAGRARWLVAPALLLIPFVLVASLIEVPFAGGFGSRTFSPSSFQSVEPNYRIAAGQLTLDLRNTRLGIQPLTIRATDVAGRILVLVPSGAPLDVRARVGAGDISLFGQNYDGFNVDISRTFGTIGPGSPGVLHLDLETSLGQVEVRS